MNSADSNPLDNVLRQFGVEPHFDDDAASPPVDKNRLRLLRDKQLDAESRDEVLRYVAKYRSWYQALLDVLTDSDQPRGN